MRALIVLSVAIFVAATASAEPMVRNADFEAGGHTYAVGWRPLPGDTRIRRVTEEDRSYLHLKLRGDADGGVVQRVDLPAGRTLSLRTLATAWGTPNGGVVASLVRLSDGVVLCELVVDGIKRGTMARNFDTGSGGEAELMVRLVGERGAQGAVDHVDIGRAVSEHADASVIYGPAGDDLVLAPGEGLIFSLPDDPTIIVAAEMVADALEDLAALPIAAPGADVQVEVSEAGRADWPASEAYRLSVRPGRVNIAAGGPAGAAWALMTLIDLMRAEPGGGVRILAAEIEDSPDLPWRAGWVGGPAAEATNAVRRLVRLKLNVALIPATTHSQGEGDWQVIGHEACEAALRHGLRPVAVLQATQASGPGIALAIETVARNLPVDRVMVVYPGAWDAEVGAAILEAAGKAGRPITIIAKLDAQSDSAAEALASWPREVIAVLGLECVRSTELSEALWRAAQNGIGYFLAADEDPERTAHLALSARRVGHQCLGLMSLTDDPEPVANAAWRAPR